MAEVTTTDAPIESGATINDIPVDDQGMAVAVPDEEEQAEAVEETTQEQQTEETTEETQESEGDEKKLQKYAESHGIELDSPSAKKAAKMAMDNQAEFQRNRQKASELEKTMGEMSDTSATQVAEATGQNPELLKAVQRLQVKDSIREFWDNNPEARQYESEMAKIANEAGLYGSPEAILKASYAMAVAGSTDSIKSQGKQEALKSLAQKQQAAVPTGKAVTSSMTSQSITPQNVDQMVASHDQAWFEKNYEQINKAMAG